MCKNCKKQLTQEEINLVNFGSLFTSEISNVCNDCYVEGVF